MRIGRWPSGAKAAFAIRDDDIGYFASREMLEMVHRESFSRGFKISFGVVPFQKGINDPNVPSAFRKIHESFPLDQNADVTEYLRDLVRRGLADIMMHGVSHDHAEFKSDYTSVLSQVRRGRSYLEETIGIRPSVFVPPWEILPPTLYQALNTERLSLSMSARRFIRSSPTGLERARALTAAAFFLLDVRRPVDPDILPFGPCSVVSPAYRYGDWRFLRTLTDSEVFEEWRRSFDLFYRHEKCFLLGTHYWQFFEDWNPQRPRPKMTAFLRQILDYVDRHGSSWKASVTEIANWTEGLHALTVERKGRSMTDLTSHTNIKGLTITLSPMERWRSGASNLEPRTTRTDDGRAALVFDMKPGDVVQIRRQ